MKRKREEDSSKSGNWTQSCHSSCLQQVTLTLKVSVSSSLIREQWPRFLFNILWCLKYSLRCTFGEVVFLWDKKPKVSFWSSEQRNRIKKYRSQFSMKVKVTHPSSCSWDVEGREREVKEDKWGNLLGFRFPYVTSRSQWPHSWQKGLKDNCQKNKNITISPSFYFTFLKINTGKSKKV